MRLGISLSYAGRKIDLPMDKVLRAERAGYDSAWVSEVYGSDAVSVASWILAKTERIRVGTAIMQIPARTPALAAMTAMSLDQLSGGRFICGLGNSGPQVVEGWHGLPYTKPITRAKEYIDIMRGIFRRESPMTYDGDIYQLPYQGADGTGLGKPLKSILEASNSIPIYMASITPAGLTAAAQYADGVLPIFYSPAKYSAIQKDLEKGFALAGNGKSLDNFDIAPLIPVVLGDDLDGCRSFIKAHIALYVGGMGSVKKNFYNDYVKKLGYEEEAVRIQQLYLNGDKEQAIALVPNELVDEIAFVGPKERMRDKAQDWKKASAEHKLGTVLLGIMQDEAIELMAELLG